MEAWFVTGSQHLYGPEALETVQQHADTIARALAGSPEIPVKIVPKPVMAGSDSIQQLCLAKETHRPDSMDAHFFTPPACGLPASGPQSASPPSEAQENGSCNRSTSDSGRAPDVTSALTES
jgi:hypothetical protein